MKLSRAPFLVFTWAMTLYAVAWLVTARLLMGAPKDHP